MKKRAALKQNVKNDTCIEFRRDIKALTLLADITSSGNLFRSWTTRTGKKLTNSNRVHVGSKDRVKTNGRTDTTDCTTFPANAVGSNDGVNEIIKQSGLYN